MEEGTCAGTLAREPAPHDKRSVSCWLRLAFRCCEMSVYYGPEHPRVREIRALSSDDLQIFDRRPPGAGLGVIYVGVSPITGKVYVGQHAHGVLGQPVRTGRWNHHERGYSGCPAIINACRKYDIVWIVLEHLHEDFLDERETYWQNQLEAIGPMGYNLTHGGQDKRRTSDSTRQKIAESWQRLSQSDKTERIANSLGKAVQLRKDDSDAHTSWTSKLKESINSEDGKLARIRGWEENKESRTAAIQKSWDTKRERAQSEMTDFEVEVAERKYGRDRRYRDRKKAGAVPMSQSEWIERLKDGFSKMSPGAKAAQSANHSATKAASRRKRLLEAREKALPYEPVKARRQKGVYYHRQDGTIGRWDGFKLGVVGPAKD